MCAFQQSACSTIEIGNTHASELKELQGSGLIPMCILVVTVTCIVGTGSEHSAQQVACTSSGRHSDI
jgi:hypothetical protein